MLYALMMKKKNKKERDASYSSVKFKIFIYFSRLSNVLKTLKKF